MTELLRESSPDESVVALVQAGRFREALEAFDAWTADGQVVPRAETEHAAAVAAARLGALDRAAVLGQSAWTRLNAAGDPVGAMRGANLLGGIAFEQGRLEVAEARFEETIRRAHALADANMAARASNNLASLMHLRGKCALSVNFYRSALPVYRREGDLLGIAQTSHNLALVYRHQGRLADALDSNEAAVMAAGQAGDQGLLALSRMGRAETWLELNDPAQAEADLEDARALATQSGDEIGIGEAHRVAALIALKREHFDQALRHAHKGQQVAVRTSCVQLSGECSAVAALAAKGVRRQRVAERFRQRALHAFRSLGAVGLIHRFELDWAS